MFDGVRNPAGGDNLLCAFETLERRELLAGGTSITIGDLSILEGNGGVRSTSAVLTLSLSEASASTVTVHYATSSETATAGGDFEVASGTATFAPGATTANVTILINGDVTIEADETFRVDLSLPTNATLARTAGRVTILNDDRPSVSIADVTVSEACAGQTAATFVATLSTASAQTVTVHYATADGTAKAGTDYLAAAGTITFDIGQTSANVTVYILGDTITEPDESFSVNLTDAVNATIADALAVGTIKSVTPPEITIASASVTEGDSGSKWLGFTVSLSAAAASDVTINYATSDLSAVSGADYTAAAGLLTFEAGTKTKTISVEILGDEIVEPDETFQLTLSNPTGATLTTSAATGTILDDEPRITVSDIVVQEGNSGTVMGRLTLTMSRVASRDVSVAWATAGGTAAAGADYVAASGEAVFPTGQTSCTIDISIVADTIVEADETIFVELSNAVNASLLVSRGTITVTNDDWPTAAVTGASVVEGNDGTAAMVFTVSLSQPPAQSITLAYATADGTALAGADYVATSGTVVFAPGQSTQTVSVTVLGDRKFEPDEAFALGITLPPMIAINDIAVIEGNGGLWATSAVFTVSLSQASAVPVSVRYSTNKGTAMAGLDFENSTGTLTFAPGQTSKTVTIRVNGDTVDEADKDFTVGLTNPVGGQIVRAVGTAVIVDDDVDPPSRAASASTVSFPTTGVQITVPQAVGTIINDDWLTVSIADVIAAEGTGGPKAFTATLTLSEAPTVQTSVDWSTSDGQAIAGSDYTASGGSVIFAAGETVQTLTVYITGDAVAEADETFYIDMSNAVGVQISKSRATVTIADDDTVGVSIADATCVEGNSGGWGGTLDFTVTLSQPAVVATDVSYVIAGVSAIAGADFQAGAGTIRFQPGQSAATISVAIWGDTVVEQAETLTVTIAASGKAAVQQATASGTIINDDSPVLTGVAPLSGAAENQPFVLTYAALSTAADVQCVAGQPVTFRVESIYAGTLTKGGLAAQAGSTLSAGEVLLWTPLAHAYGTVSAISITAIAEGMSSAHADVRIIVQERNDAPVTHDLSLATTNRQTVAGQLAGLDADGDALTFALLQGPSHGLLSFATDGAFTYTPDSAGEVWFTAQVADGRGGSADASVTISVSLANTAPHAGDDNISMLENQSAAWPASLLLANDTDIDGDTVTMTSVMPTPNTHGTLTLTDGTINYSPDTNYHGQASFQYTVSDSMGGSATATVYLTVQHVNRIPTAGDDTGFSTAAGQSLTILLSQLLANDSDSDGGALSIISIAGDAGTHGSVILQSGEIIYTPADGYEGQADFHYTISDGQGGSATATAYLTVQHVNRNPTAGDDAGFATPDGQSLTIPLTQLLANDADSDGGMLSIISVAGDANTHGSVVLQNGAIIYTPDAGYEGPANFCYAVSDGQGGTATATVYIIVQHINRNPVACDDVGYQIPSELPLNISNADLLTNDSDSDGGTLSIISVAGDSDTHGSVVLQNSTILYTPAAGYEGQAYFRYTISDGQGGTAWADVYLTVQHVNLAPTAGDDAGFATPGNQALTIPLSQLLANDTDSDGGALIIVSVDADANTHGSVVLQNGEIIYTPDAGYEGQASFQYTVSDGQGGAAVATVYLTVQHVNLAPTAGDDAGYQITSGLSLTILPAELLANDNDSDGGALSIVSVAGDADTHGSVVLQDGEIVFTPTAGYVGPASFRYAVSDGQGGIASASVSLSVLPVLSSRPLQSGKSLYYTDASGDRITILLRGPGSGSITFAAGGDLSSITLIGTAAGSSLSISCPSGAGTTLGGIDIQGSLGSLKAPQVVFAGMMEVDGTLASLTLHGASGAIRLHTNPAIPQGKVQTVLSLGDVADCAVEAASVTIKSLTVTRWLAGDGPNFVQAAAIKQASAKGLKLGKTFIIPGDFDVDLRLASAGPLKVAAAGIIGGDWRTGGSATSITAGGADGWSLHSADVGKLRIGIASLSSLDVIGRIGTIQATQWQGGNIEADTVDVLKITGDFAANATIRGSVSSPGKPAVRIMDIAGRIIGGEVKILGDAGDIFAAAIDHASLSVGDMAANQRTLKSLTLRGRTSLVGASPEYLTLGNVTAATIGKLTFAAMPAQTSGTIKFHRLLELRNAPAGALSGGE